MVSISWHTSIFFKKGGAFFDFRHGILHVVLILNEESPGKILTAYWMKMF